MKKQNRCCIVIPIYKENPTKYETNSLKQAFTILSKYKFYFVCPSNFNFLNYENELKQFEHAQFSIIQFKATFFSSIEGYNKLLISRIFYKQFVSHEYMLIYQLDAWVFKDELDYWCNQGCDYIGAPWFEGLNLATVHSQFLGVGNGGFSLRKTKSHLKILSTFNYIIPLKKLWKNFSTQITRGSLKTFVENATYKNNTFYLFNDYLNQEDFFWGLIIPKRFNWFKVPEEKTALRFSMEVNAPYLFELNNEQLPFGCHAWEKYTPDFWKKFIDV